MNSPYDFYLTHSALVDTLVCLAIFVGVARIAFWRRETGFRISGPLVVGLACLLSISLISWAGEHDYRMIDFGPLAVFIVVEAVVILIINAAVRSR
ncbi:hypothetical protein ACFL1X_05340 [Candidatus Hydrogenedentota bacterium]